jgi:hypothetical protein
MKDAPIATEAPPVTEAPPARKAHPAKGARQLELPLAASGANADSVSSSDGAYRRLDERTRRVGLEGIAAARAVLEHDGHVDAEEQSCRGGGRAA